MILKRLLSQDEVSDWIAVAFPEMQASHQNYEERK